MYLRSHAQKYIPVVYLHVCKLYTRVNLAHANWTLVYPYEKCVYCQCFTSSRNLLLVAGFKGRLKSISTSQDIKLFDFVLFFK